MKLFGLDLSPEKYEYMVNIPREKLLTWLEAGLAILPNFVVAIITILLFYPLAKLAKWAAGKVYRQKTENILIQGLVINLVFLVVLMIGVFSALEILNLDKTVTSLLAGAGVIGIALGFAFQEIASNFVSGVLISFRKPYRVGDIVEIQGRIGVVRSIDLRTTSIMMGQGLEVIVPNKTMITDTLINYTTTPERRVEINVGVSYSDDLEKVEVVAKQAVENIPERIKDRPVELYYQSFGDFSIIFKIRFWIHYPGDFNYDKSIHQAIVNIKKAFDKNGITIPFPIQTADMSMAIKQDVKIAQI